MQPLLAPRRPVQGDRPATADGTASPGPHQDPPPVSIGLCAAWSHHAAELAVPIGAALQRWEETPSTRVLVAEGQLARLLPGRYIPPDLLRSAVQRSLALGSALGAQLQSHHVIAGPSAAWVVLGGDPPATAELLSPAHRGDLAGVVLRHSRLQPGDVETIGGAPVTVPVRTAMDLLRFTPAPLAAPWLRRLVESGQAEPGEVFQRLHRMHRHPGVQAARDRLEMLLLGGSSPGVSGAQRAVAGAAAISLL